MDLVTHTADNDNKTLTKYNNMQHASARGHAGTTQTELMMDVDSESNSLSSFLKFMDVKCASAPGPDTAFLACIYQRFSSPMTTIPS